MDTLQSNFGSWKTPWGEINRFQRISSNRASVRRYQAEHFGGVRVGALVHSPRSARHRATARRSGTRNERQQRFVAVVEFGKDGVSARAVTAVEAVTSATNTSPIRPSATRPATAAGVASIEISSRGTSNGSTARSVAARSARAIDPTMKKQGRMVLPLGAVVMGAVLWMGYRQRSPQATPPSPADAFQPTIENTRSADGASPAGMVWIPGGEFSMGAAGSEHEHGRHAGDRRFPAHPSRVSTVSGWMPPRLPTRIAKFVAATGYVTIAERTPSADQFPGAPPENLVAGAVVFSPPAHAVPLNNHYQWWSYGERRELAPSRVLPAAWRDASNAPSCTSPTTTRWRMRRGPARSGCPLKRSGSSPRAAG